MKVENMTSSRGNMVANQFIINDVIVKIGRLKLTGNMFQSYRSNIVFIPHGPHPVYLDKHYWDYSITTGKYRNQFLGESKKETQAKIDSGEYILTNLNG